MFGASIPMFRGELPPPAAPVPRTTRELSDLLWRAEFGMCHLDGDHGEAYRVWR